MLKKPIILVVDDISTNSNLLELVLDEYKVIKAKSGKEALEILKTNDAIDTILLDIEMPDMDGYEVCRRIKKNPKTKDIPIIFITGDTSEESEEKGFLVGAVDYITKPIRPTIVKIRVKTQVTLMRYHQRLKELALRDQLTGLHNRYFLVDAGTLAVATALRHNLDLCVVILDIDFFKKINDTHGHLVGDAVLTQMGRLLHEKVRDEDIVARYGGEEFVIIYKSCSTTDAVKKAEAIRKLIEQYPLAGLSITVSFGISYIHKVSDSFNDMLNRADEALYKAKDDGRNRVILENNKE